MAFPRSLPPPPRAPAPIAPTSAPVSDPFTFFLNMQNSYLDMLKTPSTSDPEAAVSSTDAAVLAVMPPPAVESSTATMDMGMRELMELVSPEFTPYLGHSDSPLEETPLMTPLFDFLHTPNSNWDSPAFVDVGEFPPLFDTGLDALSFPDNKPQTTCPEALMNNMYTMPSPILPSASLYPSPRVPTTRLPSAVPTGHRKGMPVAAMVPLDAPTQPRNYYTDSKTSRKAIPAAFANKTRKRSREDAGFAVDEDEDIPAELEDAIQSKRRQNTLAARKSRARKAETARQQDEHIAYLTAQNDELRQEVEDLRAENETLRRRY